MLNNVVSPSSSQIVSSFSNLGAARFGRVSSSAMRANVMAGNALSASFESFGTGQMPSPPVRPVTATPQTDRPAPAAAKATAAPARKAKSKGVESASKSVKQEKASAKAQADVQAGPAQAGEQPIMALLTDLLTLMMTLFSRMLRPA